MRPAKNKKGVVGMEDPKKKEPENTEAQGWRVTDEEIDKFMEMVLEGKFTE